MALTYDSYWHTVHCTDCGSSYISPNHEYVIHGDKSTKVEDFECLNCKEKQDEKGSLMSFTIDTHDAIEGYQRHIGRMQLHTEMNHRRDGHVTIGHYYECTECGHTMIPTESSRKGFVEDEHGKYIDCPECLSKKPTEAPTDLIDWGAF